MKGGAKTMKNNLDKTAINLACKRLERELKLKSGRVPSLYLDGYRNAINDFLWDYAGLTSQKK